MTIRLFSLGQGLVGRWKSDEAWLGHISGAVAPIKQMTPVGFEPTQLALVELESTPLDHSGKLSWVRAV